MSADPAAANPAEQAATAAVAAAAQGCFQVLMPPPGPTSKPFIVQQPRYLASLEHLWQPGDRVQVGMMCRRGVSSWNRKVE